MTSSTMNPHDDMITDNSTSESRDPFSDAQLSILSYLKFYHLSPKDNNFYLVTCKIIPQEDSSFDVQGRYNHEFFYQYPNDSSTEYYVTCNLLSHSLVENILNGGFCGLEVDFESLSIYQKFNLEQTLKQKLKKLFRQHYDRSATFQPVPMADIQNYNNDSITQHELRDTYYNTTAQQIDFNNF